MAGIKCDSCDRKQLVKVNVLRKRVNDSQGMESTFSVWVNLKSQISVISNIKYQFIKIEKNMISNLLYIYNIYIIYI